MVSRCILLVCPLKHTDSGLAMTSAYKHCNQPNKYFSLLTDLTLYCLEVVQLID